ncbi:ornithine carbamoyltransferase [Rikenella microfusus]|uniref:ornithine carbamoyltransferase n=1 Tax=Rikenella microfusus TaxID=28139 RepID=UPI001DE6506A|nr:ornithine carbamoyltransferase [Rikenella microfusus]HJE88804.1 ornithine carbamoyltransferase [Rikenella microfusus]
MYKKSFLDIGSLRREEIEGLVRLAARLKAEKKAGTEQQYLQGRNIVLLFAKDSTRTRCSFEVGAFDQGARVTYIGSSGSQMGKKESIKDTARVLGRMYDGIEYRGYGQEVVETLAQYSGVPVWNGLTNECHPTQFLADLLTITEHCSKPLNAIKVCFAGTADNNVALSLMVGCARMGMEYSAAAPAAYHPSAALVERLRREDNARITITDNVAEAVAGADFIYTDVWVSMGEPAEVWDERIKLLRPYQVNRRMMEMTGNRDCKFMHCLPAFHDLETEVGEEIHRQYGLREMEVTDEVFESPASIVFDEAENRMHTIKAVMVATLSRQPETSF